MKKHNALTIILAGITLLASDNSLAAGTAPVEITVRADTPGAVINPAIYGQFAEHLGGLIYGGICTSRSRRSPSSC